MAETGRRGRARWKASALRCGERVHGGAIEEGGPGRRVGPNGFRGGWSAPGRDPPGVRAVVTEVGRKATLWTGKINFLWKMQSGRMRRSAVVTFRASALKDRDHIVEGPLRPSLAWDLS